MSTQLIDQDFKQRALALDATQSFIVQAPAGSGKTELLIQRFLTLLKSVQSPEEILAITFTKKAANEMRLRVLKALKIAQTQPEPDSAHAKLTWCIARDVLTRDKELGWQLLDNPNQLRIQTIDSVCAYLTKQLPLLSHFGASPAVADQPALLYRQAVLEVLTYLEEDSEWADAISKLLMHLDNDLNKLHDLLISLLGKRDQWLPYLQFSAHNESTIRIKLQHHLASVVNEGLALVKNLFPSEYIQEWLAIANFAADNLHLSNITNHLSECSHLTQLPNTTAEDKNKWKGLASLLLTKTFTWRKRVDESIGFPALTSLKNAQEKVLHGEYRKRLTSLIQALQENERLRLSLMQLFHLPHASYNDMQWDILQSLLQLLKLVAAELRITFQQHGVIDFIENAQGALLALGNEEHPTDLALLLDYQIRHILVDEFQDTSFSQYQLLEKLITGWEPYDGRTLFVVGDPMQSIYRFREAEVGIFIRMCQSGIGNLSLTPLTLAINFRSEASIVAWNNATFQTLFPPVSEMASGAVKYSPSTTLASLNNDKAVQVRGFLSGESLAQAEHIVTYIKATQTQFPNEKMAILVRSRSHLADIIPTLKKANIAYSAVAIDPLSTKQTIQDLLSLTCALLHPADRIAWLSLLRAPWCGLTLADLLAIAGDDAHQPIWVQIQNPTVFSALSPDGSKRLKRILPILQQKMADRERYDLRTFIESTWILLGGPASLHQETEMSEAQAFFNLLSELGEKSLAINIERLTEKIKTLFAPSPKEETCVQLMTIHAAKGLEFDTVILPHLERKMPLDDKSLLLWMERPLNQDQSALLLAPIHATGHEKDAIYDYIQKQQRNKSDYETDRLLYVATTRAKKRLCLLFSVKEKESGEYQVENGSFLEKLWPQWQHLSNLVEVSNHSEKSDSPQTIRYLSRLPADWENPINMPTTKVSLHQKTSGFHLPNHQYRLLGTVLHRIFQQLADGKLKWWQSLSDKERSSFLNQQLKQAGTLPIDLTSSVKLASEVLRSSLDDPKCQWILHPHKAAQSEWALTCRIAGKIENLVIDRTFIDEEGKRWIIDYKTTSFNEGDMDDFLTQEQGKYLEKMYKYQQAIMAIDERPVHLGLYFPAVPAWKEWFNSHLSI